MKKTLFIALALFGMIYAQDYLNCSKIEVLDKTQGVYRCSEYGNNFSGKRVKIENEVKRLLFFDVFMSGWDEVKEVPFEGEKGTVYNYIVYDASFNNGKLDGYVFMNYQPVAYAVRANPKSFYRSNEYKFDSSNSYFYRTGVHYAFLYSKGVLIEEISYYETGELWWKVKDVNGERNGLFKSYHKSGELESEVEYVKGKAQGLKTWYREDGSVEYTELYKNDEFVEKKCPNGRRGNQSMKCD